MFAWSDIMICILMIQFLQLLKLFEFALIVITLFCLPIGEKISKIQSDRQTELAHGFVDVGADLVIAHPHVVQLVEIYKNKAIFYSLGNFIFDQNFSLLHNMDWL